MVSRIKIMLGEIIDLSATFRIGNVLELVGKDGGRSIERVYVAGRNPITIARAGPNIKSFIYLPKGSGLDRDHSLGTFTQDHKSYDYFDSFLNEGGIFK